MDFQRHLAALRHEAAALATAARAAGAATAVPSCPGWDVERLTRHVAHAYRWASAIVSTHADAEVVADDVPQSANADPVAALDESLAELVETLANEAPGTAVWTWSRHHDTVAFWARRMAHETAVHRWDAQLAIGAPQGVDAELAADGVDELLSVFLPDHLYERPQDGLRGTFRVRATDTGDEWWGTLHPDRVDLTRAGTAAPDATVEGPASDLVLALWGRDVRVATSGDERITALLTA